MGSLITEEVAFGPFRLSPRRRALLGEKGPIALSSRAFDVLLALIEARADVISKDELMRRVWGAVTVEENNLHVQIAAVRRALGGDNRYIVTVPGKGYRFVGDLDLAAPPAPAPPPAAPAAQTNLPSRMSALIGRQGELAEICGLVPVERLVCLLGPGGVGKTKLALEAAGAVLPGFADGVWLVELGPVADPALVPSTVAAALRIEEAPGRTLTGSLAAFLRQRQALLVLDGCEHLLEAVADLAAGLLRQCPSLHLLCTSQAPLGVEGEQVRRIAPFDLPPPGETLTAEAALALDAVRLFAARAGAGDGRPVVTDETAASVVEICRSLDGIPLAIELAAARAPLLGVLPLRARIANRLALLGEHRRDAPGRQRTLRAAIAWSFGLLPEQDRQILRRLSVFCGGFTLAAAQDVAAGEGFTEWDVLRGVGALVQRSLLTTGPDLVRPRHRMLEAMRDFGLEQLEDAGERPSAERRRAQHMLTLAEEADAVWEASGGEWLAPLLPEIENLRAALGWALGPDGDPQAAAQLAAATARFWFEAGRFAEGRAWLSRAIAAAPPALDLRAAIQLKRGLADLSMDAAAAVQAAREACALAANLGDPAVEGPCLRALSAALCRQGRYGESEAVALQAFERLRGGDRWRTLAACVADLGLLRGVAGDHAQARRYNAEAEARLKALGDDRRAAICLQYAAEFEFASGHAGPAIRLAEESVALFRPLNGLFHLEIGLGNLAAYRLVQGDPAGGGEAAREALVLARDLEDGQGVACALDSIALALALSGCAETAARLHGHVEEARRRASLERQATEQAVHERLTAALAKTLPPERRLQLIAEGRMLAHDNAIAVALRTPQPVIDLRPAQDAQAMR